MSDNSNKADLSAEWGKSDSSTGWENSGVPVGWGKSDSSAGWGKSDSSTGWGKSDSSTGWGNSNSSSGWGAPDSKISLAGWGKSDSSNSQTNVSTDISNGWGKISSSSTSNKDLESSVQSGWGKVASTGKSTENTSNASEGNGWGTKTSSNSWGCGSWGGIESIQNPFKSDKDNESKSPNEEGDDESIKHQKQNTFSRDMYSAFGVPPPKPAITFSFGTGKEFPSTNDPGLSFEQTGIKITSFQLPAPPPQVQNSNNDNDDDSNEITLEPVNETTGEEGEEILFNEKARAFAIKTGDDNKKGYVEIGIGELHLNHNTENNFYRMTMRRDLQNIVLNTRIFKGMNPKLKKKMIQFLAQDSEGKMDIKTFSFENEEKAKKLYDLIVDIISKL